MGAAISSFKKTQTPTPPKSAKDHDATLQSVKSDSDKVTNIFVQIVGDDAQSINVKKSMCTQTDDTGVAEYIVKDVANQTNRLETLSFRDFTEDHGIYDSSPPDSYRCEFLSPRTSTVNPAEIKSGTTAHTKHDKHKSGRQSSSVSVIDMESDTEDDVTLSMDGTINVPTTSPNIAYKSLDFDEHDRITNTYETPVSSSCINKGYYETKDNLQANSIHSDKGTQYSLKELCDSMTQTDLIIDSRAHKDRQVPSNGPKFNHESVQQAVVKKHKRNASSQTVKSTEYAHTNNIMVQNKHSQSGSPIKPEPIHQEQAKTYTTATQTQEFNHSVIVMASPTGKRTKHTSITESGENSPLVTKSVTSATQTENKLKYIVIPDTTKTELTNKPIMIEDKSTLKHSLSTQTAPIDTIIPNYATNALKTQSSVTKHTPAPTKETKEATHEESGTDSIALGSQQGKKSLSIQTQTNVTVLSTTNQSEKQAVTDTHHPGRETQQIPDPETHNDLLIKSQFGFAPMCSPSSSAPPTSPASDLSDGEVIMVNYDSPGGRELRVYIPTGENTADDTGEYSDFNRYTKTPLTPIPEEEKSIRSVQSLDDTADTRNAQHVKLPVREYSAKSISTQTTEKLSNSHEVAIEHAQVARNMPATSHGYSEPVRKTPDVELSSLKPNRASHDVRKSPEASRANAPVNRTIAAVTVGQHQPVHNSPDAAFASAQTIRNNSGEALDHAQPVRKSPDVAFGHTQQSSAHTAIKHGGFGMHRENSGSSDSKSEFEIRFDMLNKQDGVPFKPEIDGYQSVSDRSARTLNEEGISLANTPELRSARDGNLTSRSCVDAGMKKIGKCKIRLASDNENCILTAAMFMDNGGVVIVDRANKKVKFIDAKFQFISQVEVTKRPWGACAIGKDIYVTIGKTKIQQITLDEEMVLDLATVIETKEKCLGIAAYDDRLAIGLQRGQICLMSLSGEAPHMINLPFHKGKPCNPWHMCVTRENAILVTDAEAELVFCVNKNSEVLFHYKGMSSPRGCAIELQGSVIVVGRDQETGDGVHVMNEGVKEKTLMSWWNLEFVPYCAAMRAEDGVIIMGGIKDAIQIYKYSSV